jgi:hypothetical protein
MKRILSALKRIPMLTRILLTTFCVVMIIAIIIGIDNDRGILMGWLATTVLLIEISRRWRKEWQFLLLSVGAVVGAIFLSFLHEAVVYPLVERIGGAGALQSRGLEIFHFIITDIILLFTPMGIIIGIIGAITLFFIRLIMLGRKKSVSG